MVLRLGAGYAPDVLGSRADGMLSLSVTLVAAEDGMRYYFAELVLR